MSYHLKLEYLELLRSQYLVGSKSRRSQIIDEVCRNTGMHRKSAIRCLRAKMTGRRAGSGRKKIYSPETVYFLRKLWIKTDQMCSKKLKRAMPYWTDKLPLPVLPKSELLKMSASTIDRYLKPYRAQFRRNRIPALVPGSC